MKIGMHIEEDETEEVRWEFHRFDTQHIRSDYCFFDPDASLEQLMSVMAEDEIVYESGDAFVLLDTSDEPMKTYLYDGGSWSPIDH
tara:strand:+ start:448 stop:705 length:258 start_codon:yes stop_codon:yes gene_type:complete